MTENPDEWFAKHAKPEPEPERPKARVHAIREPEPPYFFRTKFTSIKPILDSPWQIKGVIPRRGVGAIYGKPGSGKTFVAFDMALHTAAGLDWRGRRTKRANVIYLLMESGGLGENRVHASMQNHGREWPEGFFLSPIAQDLRTVREETRFGDQINKAAYQFVAEMRKSPEPIGLVVIDTLARALAGGKEDDRDLGLLIANCEWIANELQCFVLLVHHCGKDEDCGMRGHSSLLGAVTTEIEVKREPGQAGTIKIAKQRDGEDGAEFHFRLERVLLGHDEDGDEISSCVAIAAEAPERPAENPTKRPLADSAQIALNALVKAVGEEGVIPAPCDQIPPRKACVDEKTWRKYFYAMKGGKPDTVLKAFDRAQDKLQTLGRTNCWEGLCWVVRE